MNAKVVTFPAGQARLLRRCQPFTIVFGTLLLLGCLFWAWVVTKFAEWAWRTL